MHTLHTYTHTVNLLTHTYNMHTHSYWLYTNAHTLTYNHHIRCCYSVYRISTYAYTVPTVSNPTTPVESLHIVNMVLALTLQLTLYIADLRSHVLISISPFCSTYVFYLFCIVLLILIAALLGKSKQGRHFTVLVYVTIQTWIDTES
jgi:hypothetical protein